MTIITNDPFDSIGFGVEWLKQLGVSPDDLISEPLRSAISDFKGDVIIVVTVNGRPASASVFNEKEPAHTCLESAIARKYVYN